MNPKGPYFHAPCQRDRFPSLVDEMGEDGDRLVSHLGISNISDMGARLKRGARHSKASEKRAANAMKDSCEPMIKLFQSSSSLRRGVDKFAQMPKYDPYATERDHLDPVERQRKILARPNPIPAPRQAGEPPYTGRCQHCRNRGSNDVANDYQGRLYLAQAYQMNLHPALRDGQQQQQNEEAGNRNFG